MNQRKLITEVSILAPVPISPKQKSNFGQKRSYETHPGVDIPVPVGTNVLAPMNGIVKLADFNYNKLCGATIDIDYQNGFWSRFCHMSKINVKEGDNVVQGQVVGLSGGAVGDAGSGNSQGPHLHFTLKKGGKLVDPLEYINKTVPDSQLQSDSSVENVQSVASKLGSNTDEMSWEEFRKKYPPELVGKALEKSISGVFTEEIKRIKQLMK